MPGEENVDLSPDLSVYVSFFTIIIAWTFLGVFVGQNILVLATPSLLTWLLFSSLIVVTFLIPISGVSWYVKQQSVSLHPEWNFVERDVGLEEYRVMVDEYHSSYSHLMSVVHIPRSIIVVFLGFLCIEVPYLLNQISFTPGIFSAPVFGICLLLYGIGLLSTVYPAMPGNLVEEFPRQVTKKFSKGLDYLSQIPGIYWIGIRLTIGKWAGYYTLRDPALSATIEGIESVANIICQVDSAGRMIEVTFQNESEHQGFPIEESFSTPSSEVLRDAISQILRWYIETTGEQEILQDVLDEVTGK
jgi:hypothetical protein